MNAETVSADSLDQVRLFNTLFLGHKLVTWVWYCLQDCFILM